MRTAALFRSIVGTCTAVACLLALARPAAAEPPRVQITAAQVGLPPANPDAPGAAHVCKFATWAPLYVELNIVSTVNEPAELVVETPDADGVLTTLAVPLNLGGTSTGTTVAAQAVGMMPYLRPAAGTGETTVTVRTAAGAALSEPFRIRSLRPRDANTYVVLALGSRLTGFALQKLTGGTGDAETTAGPIRGGRLEVTALVDVGQLPDQWFGYNTADLVILPTGPGSEDFLNRLFADPANLKKRAALEEWVRRGGRLVISTGSNAGLVAKLSGIQELLPYSITAESPSRTVDRLPLYWTVRETGQSASTVSGTLAGRGQFPVANLTPKPLRPARVVVPPPSRQTPGSQPVAVQAGLGLGRVTLVGFDLDQPPFSEFGPRAEFWDWVLREGGANRASGGANTRLRTDSTGPSEEEDEVAAALRTHGDTFDAVPVVSFSWVAILIGLYIVLIGPIEYYVLRQVFGRLELTWLTFPVIVATVCTAAYLTALAAKGRELRVNRVDVIEVVADTDPQTRKPAGRVLGSTWFTVFSPRIDTYTLGVTPAEGWVAPGNDGASLLGWVGSTRGGRASLLRRRYAYHVNPTAGIEADGLDGVPVQVWSTKAFAANWAGPVDPATPVVESRLEHPPGDPARAIGTFVNRMPVAELSDCVAFYAGQAYPLGTILGGQEVRLVLDRGIPASQWLQERGQLNELLSRAAGSEPAVANPNRPATGPAQPTPTVTAPGATLPLWGLLFHEAALRNEEGVVPHNASLRRLDQSWRLAADNRDEVIVVGRVLTPPGAEGAAESAARLWLKGRPGPGGAQPPAPTAAVRQETYVRLYLPVLPAGARP